MKLTSKILEKLILEVMNEVQLLESYKHIPHKNQYEAAKHKAKLQRSYEATRKKKKEIFPGNEELLKLSKGILQEEELLSDEDEAGFVKIKSSALQRLLKEGQETIDIEAACRRKGYHQLQSILNFINNLNSAEKGTLNK